MLCIKFRFSYPSLIIRKVHLLVTPNGTIGIMT